MLTQALRKLMATIGIVLVAGCSRSSPSPVSAGTTDEPDEEPREAQGEAPSTSHPRSILYSVLDGAIEGATTYRVALDGGKSPERVCAGFWAQSLSPDGTLLTGQNSIRRWEVRRSTDGRVVHAVPPTHHNLTFLDNSNLLVQVTDEDQSFSSGWRLVTRALETAQEEVIRTHLYGEVSAAPLYPSPDGAWVGMSLYSHSSRQNDFELMKLRSRRRSVGGGQRFRNAGLDGWERGSRKFLITHHEPGSSQLPTLAIIEIREERASQVRDLGVGHSGYWLDSTRLLLLRFTEDTRWSTARLVVYDLNTGTERTISDRVPLGTRYIWGWVIILEHSDEVVFLEDQEGGADIKITSLADQPPTSRTVASNLRGAIILLGPGQ